MENKIKLYYLNNYTISEANPDSPKSGGRRDAAVFFALKRGGGGQDVTKLNPQKLYKTNRYIYVSISREWGSSPPEYDKYI